MKNLLIDYNDWIFWIGCLIIVLIAIYETIRSKRNNKRK